MSDEWLKLLQEERIEREKLNERISELEASSASHTERILKSEHRIEYDTMAISWGEELRDSIKLNVKEIAELRASSASHTEHIALKLKGDQNFGEIREIYININDLKGQLNELKEVGSARQTEKKNYMDKIYPYLKDLGGEKDVSEVDESGGDCFRLTNREDTSTHLSDDSKPPEPKWYPGVKEYCDFMEDRLPGGTGIEPREDEPYDFAKTTQKTVDRLLKRFYKNHICVKREDLLVDIKTLRECKAVECVTCDEIIKKWEAYKL